MQLWAAAIAHLVEPFLFGGAAAETVGTGITDSDIATIPVIVAAVQAAVIRLGIARHVPCVRNLPASTVNKARYLFRSYTSANQKHGIVGNNSIFVWIL